MCPENLNGIAKTSVEGLFAAGDVQESSMARLNPLVIANALCSTSFVQSSVGLFANCDISFYIIIYYAYISQPVIIYGSITTIPRKLMYKQVLCPREWIGKQIFFGYIMFKLWWIEIEPSSFLYLQRRVIFFVY
ncbi:uncharacterized protein LOC115987667 isoform X1 [Quercus lobata]|uniref:uncharacterized protein LOC115987667 isoform X1 n=1 Tax=Quercus lobata TaxID=97700 RepID=UPI0012453812|nr:uncharacterized protein LOC115987667 isoform X1 [Quercus lobata]